MYFLNGLDNIERKEKHVSEQVPILFIIVSDI